ncbi:hypothetical protein M0R04_06570 [Candidatus Dojkabacteria bacterium]|jgi:hypothetical protein|nr:hypothetical protein [Candidatus Dojkabacteria bacterium]
MMVKLIAHDHKCDKCNKPAVYNLQNVNVLYDITPTGNFKKNDEWEGDFNDFYCEKHYEEEMN